MASDTLTHLRVLSPSQSSELTWGWAPYVLQSFGVFLFLLHNTRVFLSPDLLRRFFEALYDQNVIHKVVFEKWELSMDPAEQQGKGVALKSVTVFFTRLRIATFAWGQ